MTLKSKKVSLVLLFILSLVLSRTVFWFIDDPEGPNLLIVTVLAIIIYIALLGLYQLFNKLDKPRALRILKVVLAILLIPFFGNIFVEGWNWGVFDFIIAGALLFATGAMIDCTIRTITSPLYRTLAVVSIVLAFILLWVELAVDAVSRLLSSLF